MSELNINNTTIDGIIPDCDVINLGPGNIENSSTYLNSDDLEIGVKGDSGVGIKDIITVESEDDGGKNEVTIVLTNNESHKFYIRNGSQYKLSVNDKKEIAEEVADEAINIISNTFVKKEEIKRVDIKTATETNDGFASSFDVKTTIHDSHNSVVFFEDYKEGEKIIIL